MRRLTAFAAALAFAFAGCAPALAGSIGATQAWVSNYVERVVARERPVEGGTAFTAGDATVILEDQTVPALLARDPTARARAAGIADGAVFAWNDDDGAYRHGDSTIRTSATNMAAVVAGTACVWDARRPDFWLRDAQTNWMFRLVRATVSPTMARWAWEGVR